MSWMSGSLSTFSSRTSLSSYPSSFMTCPREQHVYDSNANGEREPTQLPENQFQERARFDKPRSAKESHGTEQLRSIANKRLPGGKTRLHSAVIDGDIFMVKIWVNNEATLNLPDDKGATPLQLATKHGYVEIVKILVQAYIEKGQKTSLDQESHALWRLAIECGNEAIMGIFKEASVDINYQDSKKNTLLHIAAESEDLALVKGLLENGADQAIRNGEHSTALHIATLLYDCPDVVEALLAGENAEKIINLPDQDQAMALHNAVVLGFSRVCKLLIEKGAEKNARDLNGRTPIMMATQYGRIGVVRMLADAHAEVDLKNPQLITAIAVLKKNQKVNKNVQNTKRILEILEKADAEQRANTSLSEQSAKIPQAMASIANIVKPMRAVQAAAHKSHQAAAETKSKFKSLSLIKTLLEKAQVWWTYVQERCSFI